MAKVTLIDYTGIGSSDALYAARLLAFTKNTRLNMTPGGLDEWTETPAEKILEEMAYMASTIPSSWEFVDVTFSIQDVTRACAQQMTRTRNASYAMQSQRVTDVGAATYRLSGPLDKVAMIDNAYREALVNYRELVANGVPLEDARGILPLNIHCNLIAKYNLRSFVELARARDSLRVQGEYVDIVRQMKAEVLRYWPWSAPFFELPNEKAVRLLEEVAREVDTTPGAPTGLKAKLAKAADLLKKG